MSRSFRRHLFATSLLGAAAFIHAPLFAQDISQSTSPEPTPAAAPPAAANAAPPSGGEIVVTGSLIRRSAKDIPPTLVDIDTTQLANRGITTVAQALQTLSANGAGTLPASFSANGAFASGATAPALRGLTTNSTLVLFDGLRSAYYPLADDGQRNFVDTNTIPEAIIDRIQVLQDGASATYGADAVAGVVNIIVKKEIKGFHGNLEGGVSRYGDAGERRGSATYGYGDLSEDGFNVYANVEYQKDNMLRNRDRGYPYNTADLSGFCNDGTCLTNGVQNGIQFNGAYPGVGTTTVPIVRPANNNADAAGVGATSLAGSRYQLLNPTLGCGSLNPVSLTPAQAASTAGATAALNNCQQDLVGDYSVIQPSQERLGATLHATVNIGSRAQAYAMFNYYRNEVYFTSANQAYRVSSPTGTAGQGNLSTLSLPVYVCAGGVNCDATNGTLNPNNPFAAAGQRALIVGRFGDIPRSNRVLSQTYHGSAGVKGSFGDDWNYKVDFTGSHVSTKSIYKGVVYLQHLLDVVNDGSYNFLDPSANSQGIRNYIAPTTRNVASSDLYQLEGSLQKGLFELPGGTLQVAVGGSGRYEKVDAPSANPDTNTLYDRYSTAINPFGTSGHRWVESGFFEISAPILKMVEVNGSGRYDHYSSGQNNFSPKIGASFTPIREIAFHGTWSRGFRVPSFAEAYALPTTGYVNDTPPASFAAQHPGLAYGRDTYSLGLTSIGNRDLKPEKSESFTGGVTIQPKRWLSLTADYYHIKKTNVIVSAPGYADAVAAYYAGQPIPAGFRVIPGTPDPQNPNALPLAGFVESSYVNANSLVTSGVDLSFTASVPLTDSIKWTSNGTATWVQKLNQTLPDGTVQHYAGTLGPYQTTSASGTPRWRASWTNTIEVKNFSLSGTVYYTSGYQTTAEDAGDVRGDCSSNESRVYRDGSLSQCNVKRFIDVDMTATYKINDKFSIYTNIYNVFDAKPPIDLATYGGYLYNPAWANAGILGRYFKVGVNFGF